MKKHILLGLFLTLTLIKVYGQESHPTPAKELYVVKLDDKILFTDSNGISVEEADSVSKKLVYINPSWIDSIDIVKGKDATDIYGLRGKNGAVVMTLHRDTFFKLRAIDRDKFKEL